MTDCCTDAGCAIEKLQARQRATLVAVLWINLVLFAVEATAGVAAGSIALLGDALDMLGDALVYAFSLYVVARGPIWKMRAARLKGWIMAGFGVVVLGQALYRLMVPELPHYPTMGVIGVLALAANGLCLGLLWRHRSEDVNMSSVWLCSRNDIVANVSVLGAAAAVWALQSQIPDIVVGVAIAALFLHSAAGVLRESGSPPRALHVDLSGTAAHPQPPNTSHW